MTDEAPYAELSPEAVLDALESLGMRCDGRILELNSYENRVYQIGIEDAPPVVAKFYRPARWSDAAILEEHAFAAELQAQEIPVVAPTVQEGKTLHLRRGFRYAVFPRRGGRWPELGTADERQWVGRFLGRIHAVGRSVAFRHRAHLDVEELGRRSRDFLLDEGFVEISTVSELRLSLPTSGPFLTADLNSRDMGAGIRKSEG